MNSSQLARRALKAAVPTALAMLIPVASGAAAPTATATKRAPLVRIKGNHTYGAITNQDLAPQRHQYLGGSMDFHLNRRKRVDALHVTWICPHQRYYREVQLRSFPGHQPFKPIALRGRHHRAFTIHMKAEWSSDSVGVHPIRSHKGTAKLTIKGRFRKRHPHATVARGKLRAASKGCTVTTRFWVETVSHGNGI